MKDGTKFLVSCPVCNRKLSELGIADGRLYYECLHGFRILRTRFEQDQVVLRRLKRNLAALSEEVKTYGHHHEYGYWSRNLVWRPLPNAPAGDEYAEVFLSFRYFLRGDKLIPVHPKDAPKVQLPEEALETGDWEWTDKNKVEVSEDELKSQLRAGPKRKKKS